jgi:large subunit ribosomal protein L24
MNNIRKGDEVIVLTGRDRKRRGTVLQRIDADHVLVEGVNVVKKHTKPNPMANNPGGIVEKTMPIHISNVALFNPATGKGDRVGVKVVEGRRVRIFRSNGAEVGAKAAKA